MKLVKYVLLPLVAIVVLLFAFRVQLLSFAVGKYVATLNQDEKIPFTITYDEFTLDIAFGSLQLFNIHLTPKKVAETKNLQLVFTAKSFVIDGLNLKKLLYKNLDVESIVLTEPNLIYYMKVDKEGKAIFERDSTKQNVPVPWLDILQATDLNHIAFVNGSINVFKVNRDTTQLLALHGYTIDVHGGSDSTLLDRTKENIVSFDSVYYNLGDKMHMKAARTVFNLKSKSLQLNGVRVGHVEKRKSFLNKLKYKANWMDLAVDHIEMNGLDFGKLEEIKLVVDSIKVSGANVKIADKSGLKRPKGFQGKMINDWFMAIPEALNFKHLQAKDVKLTYTMHDMPFEGDMVIPIKIDLLEGDFTDNIAAVSVKAFLFSSPVRLHVKAHIDSSYKTDVSCQIKNIDKVWFTKITHTFIGVDFVEGDQMSMDFNYRYHGQAAITTGIMDFRYKNLKVFVNRRVDHERHSNMLTFAANSIIKNNNFPGEKKYVKAPIDFKKKEFQGFIGHLIFCALDGAQYAMIKKK